MAKSITQTNMKTAHNNPRRRSILIAGKLGKRRSHAGMARQLLQRTAIAAAISSMGVSAAWGDIVTPYGRTDDRAWVLGVNSEGQRTLTVTIDKTAGSLVNSPGTENRAIVVLESGGQNIVQINYPTAPSSDALQTVFSANDPISPNTVTGAWDEFGPSLYHVLGAPNPKATGSIIDATMGPVWLDAYQWYSGYIYQETTDLNIDWNSAPLWGYGFVPGIINLNNQGCAPTGPDVCQDSGEADGKQTYLTMQGNSSAQINVEGMVGYGINSDNTPVRDAMSTSLPWRAAGASISVTSNGGQGWGISNEDSKHNNCCESGDGGQAVIGVSDYLFTVGTHSQLKAGADAPFAVLSAVSRGGGFGTGSLLSNDNTTDFDPWPWGDKAGTHGGGYITGDFGPSAISINNTTISSRNNSSFIIGISAVSLGGATQTYYDGTFYWGGTEPGPGGDISVEVTGSSGITLPFNNSIGVIATSSGDQTIVKHGESAEIWGTGGKYGFDNGSPGTVMVQLEQGTSVLVGDKSLATGSAKSAGDTNIGVLANSSSNWGRELFTGNDLLFVIPGDAGTVTVQSAADVTVYGPNAVGVLAQSIGGKSISAPGTSEVGDAASPDVTAMKDTLFTDSNAGSVTYTSIYTDPSNVSTSGGSISAYGDGATGLLLQSIGGGGGAGGDATGLFVAIGGQGGNGGNGGTLTVTLQDQSVTTNGSYAKGVIGHSVGGGGGSGGHATAFSLLSVLPSVGIGGAGGSGGDGGSATFTGKNASVTTDGQHAMGLVLQSIGGGGGTGGAVHNYSANIGFTVEAGVGGSGGDGGAGGALTVTLDDKSSITTTGLDSHGVLLQSISGGGGAGGGASGTTYNTGAIPDIPVSVSISMNVGGSGGNSETPGLIKVTNDGAISTSGAGSHGLVLQSIGGGGGHGADSTSGTNSWGAIKETPSVNFTMATALGGTGGAAGDGGDITLTSRGTIATWGHNAMGVLAHSIGGGGGTGGQGNAYSTDRWVSTDPDKENQQIMINTNLGVGGKGSAGGAGGSVSVTITKNGDVAPSFASIGAGSSAVVAQSVGGGGGVAGDAGTQALNGGKVTVGMQLGGAGGSGGDGGATTVNFNGNIQTGAVVQLQYTDDNGQTQRSSPVTIGGSSHGIVAQSIGGGGGIGGNADPSTALVPTLNKTIATWSPFPNSVGKVLNIKDGIEFWAKRVVEDGEKRPEIDVDYNPTLTVGGSGGSGGDGQAVNVTIGKSDITTYGHHSYGVMAQSIGGGGGVAGNATAHSILSGDVSADSLGKDVDLGMTLTLGGSGGVSGDGGDVVVLSNNPLDSNYQPPNVPADGNAYAKGNYIRTGGYASHALFAQSVGGGGGVGHEGSIFGLASLQGESTPKATLGNVTEGGIAAGDGGSARVGDSNNPIVGWIETAGDASSLLFAQSIGGGGGTISFGCTTNGRAGNTIIRHSPCFTDAAPTWDNGGDTASFSAGQFVNGEQEFDLTLSSNGGSANIVEVYLGDSHMVTDGDRAIAIVAQAVGGGGGYISADALNVGLITQSAPVSGQNSQVVGSVNVVLEGAVGGKGTAYIGTYGDGAWGVLAQSIGGGGGLFGDTSLDIVGAPTTPTTSTSSTDAASFEVSVSLTDAIIHTSGTNSHGIVAQSWSNGGGIFAGNNQNPTAPLVLGSTRSDAKSISGSSDDMVDVSVNSTSEINAKGDGSIGIIGQTNYGNIKITIAGTVSGGTTYTNTAADNRVVQGIGVLLSGGGTNEIKVDKGGQLLTAGQTDSGYAIMTDGGTTNVTNEGTITGSVDLGSTPGTFTNESGGVLNKGAVYKVGNNSLHNYGTINIGNEDSVSTTNLEGRIVQYDGGRMLVTFDVLGEQTNDRLIVDGTAVLGGSFETRAKSLLPGDYEFLTATNLTVTAEAADRLLYAWDATVTDSTVTVTPTRTFRAEGLSLSPTSQNLVSYLERAWDNADAHHAALFGYKHELEGIEDYNALLESLGGQALNAQPLQMRMSVLSNLGDSMACPVVTPNGLRLGEQRCVWAKLTGEVSDLSASDNNIGYNSTGGGLRVGVQQPLTDGWTVGVAAGYALNDLTATNFSSNGQMFDLSVSAKRDVGQWSFGGSVGYAHGWFDNSRSLSAPDAGIASGFSRRYDSNSSLSIYSAKLRAAYTFEQDEHYIRPYVDFDVAYSHAPGFSESGQGDLALQTQSSNQWNMGISPMVEYGADFVRKDKTRMMFFVSAGATFLPNNQQTTPTSFVGAQAANGTFDVVTDGPNVLGRLNLGMQVYEQEGYEVRAQYGLQAGDNYWSQSVSINAVFRF